MLSFPFLTLKMGPGDSARSHSADEFIYQDEIILRFEISQLDQAKVENLRLLYFRLGYCGSDEEVKTLTLKAIGAAGSFWALFSEKSALSWPLKRPESQEGKCLAFKY